MKWAEPTRLWLLALVPLLLAVLAIGREVRRRLLARLGDAPLVARLAASASPSRRAWGAAMRVAAIALVALALARPQVGGRASLVRRRGLDLVVALDFSKSMLAADVRPTRLARARLELDGFLRARGGDRVGLVAFAGDALRYPLTTDHEAARLFWRDLTPVDMPVGGSDLGAALDAALELFAGAGEDAARDRAIVLITDGDDTGGRARAAADAAVARGVRIFAVGLGSPAGDLVPELDAEGQAAGWKSRPGGGYVTSRLDEELLRALADRTGGVYVAGGDGAGVERIAAELDRLRKSERDAALVVQREEAYAALLLPAFLLLIWERCLGDRKRSW